MNRHARRARAFAFAVAALFATACHPRVPSAPPLASVSPLPSPSPGAPIASVAPAGDVDTLAQVRVIFAADLIPLERLESSDEQSVLAHFSLEPALPGRFRFLTPRMIGFEAERAWPAASRIRVTISKGLKDRAGHELASDVAWTFQTPGIALDGLPKFDPDAAPAELAPKVRFTSNVPLDRTSLAAHATLRAHDDAHAQPIPLGIPADNGSATAGPTAQPEPQYDRTADRYGYVLVPASQLAKGTLYDVVIEPGVLPRDGNRASERAFHGQLKTYDALRYVGMRSRPGPARFTTGQPKLAFSTPIDEKSLSALTLDPAPPKGATPFAVIYPNAVVVNTGLLAPQTGYTVHIGAALADTFGQRLGSAQTATFRTGDLTPDVWAPSGLNLFPSSRDVRLNVIAVNAPPGVRAAFRPLAPADVVQHDDPSGSEAGSVLGESRGWAPFDVHGPKNAGRTVEVPLEAKLGASAGALAYGVTATLPGQEEPFVAAGVVQLTDLGVFAQWFPDGGTVRVNRITDGTPVSGARVEVYPSQADAETKSTPEICAAARTGLDGAAEFRAAAFARCAQRDTGEGSAPSFVTVVRSGADWTYVRTGESSGAYAGDFYNGWSSGKPMQRGTFFSDRELYQPGETAQLTAVGWFLANGVLRRGIAPSYAVTLEKPNGEHTDLGSHALDAFGEFSLPVTLPKNAPLGYYTIRANAGIGEQISGTFRVAEFKPPNFKVDLTLDRDVAQRGESVTASANNAYLFGAPLTGASTHFVVTRSVQSYAPKGREDYQFGRQWFWPDQQPDASTDVLDSTASVDASGKSIASVKVADDLPFAMQYEIDAETTDPSNVAVADSKTFTALPTDTLVGVRTDAVGTAGTPLTIAVLATDPAGKPRAGTSVHVELQAATYNSATQIVEGAEQAVQSVSYSTAAAGDASSGERAVEVKLTPPKPGTYRVRAMKSGDSGSETDVEVYVGGSGEARWYARDPNALTVKLDKSSYKPGETATALVQSPYPRAELHVMVVRHGILWQTTQQVEGAAPTVRFTVTPEMLPNAAVQAFLVRRGAPPPSDMRDGGNALARTGFAAFGVALDGKYLKATVRAERAALEPAARQTVHVHLTDGAQHPVRGEATLMVVNEAVLRLTGYRPPDLVKEVYAEQPISVRYADNRSALVLHTLTRPVEKGWGFGGGLSSGDTDPRVRRTFSALAYFAGALHTDANGDASATFTLPDDLTTWRAMVVTVTADGRFGNADTTFRTTKPLVANPVMPQFARPGDRFEGGVAITGTRVSCSGAATCPALHIDATLAGPLRFVLNADQGGTAATSTRTTLDTTLESITKAYRFPVAAGAQAGDAGPGTGDATVSVSVKGAGTGDAFAIPLPVRGLDVLEAVAQTGTTDTRAAVSVDVAGDTPRDAGGLDVSLASTLIPEVAVAANAALDGDERLALSAAARLAIAADLIVLARPRPADRKLRDRALLEISILDGLRRADGGFAVYRLADRSDARDSLVALSALARARAALCEGARVAACAATPLFDGARRYAAAVLADPTAHEKWCTSAQCKAELRLAALDALAAAGDRRTTFLTDIDALREELSFADQARLARLLSLAPEYRDRAASLAKTIDDRLYATARGAAVTLPARYAWYDDRVVAQAEALQLELVRNAPAEQLDRLTRSLLDMRRNGSFGCPCENAAALNALVDLAARERPANFTARASIGPKTIAEQRFSGAHVPERRASLAMRDLPAGTSQLRFEKNGSGTLHYAATYRYRLGGSAPGRMNGLRVTRVVREANASPMLATLGLGPFTAPLTLPAAHVYDVELQVVSDHPVERVLISDPLPAGFEAIDTSFATSSKAHKLPGTDWAIGDQQIRSDRIEAYADHLDAGIYRLHYLARTVTPGTFAWPGAEAHLAGRADEFGRSASTWVTVK